MTDLPLTLALSSVLAAAVDGGRDRHALLSALTAGQPALASRPAVAERLAPVVPLRRPARPGRPGPDQPQAA